MEQHNRERERLLSGFTVRRVYYVINYLTGRQARMEVRADYRAPDQKEFQEISASGSKFLRNRVFKALMESEQAALHPEQKQRSAITQQNYDFALLGEEPVDGRRQYVLLLTAKRKEKYLLKGKIWVDAEDFAIARIEAEPVKKLSFWTRKVNLVRKYRKVGEFWLPASDETVTDIFIFGRSLFTIEYGDYRITRAAGDPPPTPARSTH